MNRRLWVLSGAVLFGLALSVTLASACNLPARHRDVQPVSIPRLSRTTVITPTAVVRAMLGQVNRDRALADLRRLTGEDPICAGTDCYTITHRLTGSEGLRWATDAIARELAPLGFSVSLQEWSRSGWSDRNVIARKPGAYIPAEEIYFIAHVDGVKKSAEGRFPAADDNASGAVGLLELARVLSTHTFSRTVVLLFSTGEEQGTLGVQSFLSRLTPEELGAIKVAVDVDVIGYDGNRDGVMELWHGDSPTSIAVTQMMSETIEAYQLALAPKLVVGCG